MNPAVFATITTAACTLGTQGSFGPDRITRNVYDAAGHVTQVRRGVGSADQVNETTNTYTLNGRLAALTDAAGNRTTYEYDGHDRLLKTRFPSPSTDGVSSTTDYEQLSYELLAGGTRTSDLVASRRLRDGQAIASAYDALGRVTFKNLPGAEPDVSYTYDLMGRMLSATRTGHALTFTYDALGRNLTQVSPLGTVSSTWDAGGRRTRLTYAGTGLYVDYDYLVTGEVTKIRENGATTGAGVLATYAYDNLGRRTGITRGNGTTTAYSYDGVSRLSQLTENLAGTTSDLALGFGYNPAGQIVSNTRSNDAYSFTGSIFSSRNDSHNGLNQVTAIGTTVVNHNDARGNVTAIGASAYGYNSESRLTTAPGSVTLAYDPMLRLYQSVGSGVTTRFAYDDAAMIAEYNASNVLQRRFVHGPGVDEPLVWYEGATTATRRWFHADERGSVIAVSDSLGNLFGTRNRYDDYGAVQGTLTGRFGFTGQAWLPEAGLWYFKARMYNPMLGGRFMQTDPLLYEDGPNIYVYAHGDPVNGVDPTGQYDCIGTTRQCSQAESFFEGIREVLEGGNISEQQADFLGDIVETLGLPGEENGVVVTFGRINGIAAGEATLTGGLDEGTIKLDLNVINRTASALARRNSISVDQARKAVGAAALAHEGGHVWFGPLLSNTARNHLRSERVAYTNNGDSLSRFERVFAWIMGARHKRQGKNTSYQSGSYKIMPFSLQGISPSMLPKIAFLSISALVILAGCAPTTTLSVDTSNCWDESEMQPGRRLEGTLVAYFSPDSPLTLRNNKCQDQRLLALFDDSEEDQRYIEEMRNRSTGDWFGGQIYMIRFAGEAQPRLQNFPGIPVEVSEFQIIRNIRFNGGAVEPGQ